MFLEISQNSQENTCARVSCNFIKKETLAQVFSCDIYEISKNTFFLRNTSGGCFCSVYGSFLFPLCCYLAVIRLQINLIYIYQFFLKDTLKIFHDLKMQARKLWSNISRYLKVCIFWKRIPCIIHWGKTNVKKISFGAHQKLTWTQIF